MANKNKLIRDGENLLKAEYKESGYAIPTYDDGFGPLWIHRNSIGVSGIVRARTWGEAYSICADEFFPEADETVEELIKEYGFKREYVKIVRDADGERDERFPEDYPNGKLVPEFVRWETREIPDPDAWSENELFCEAFGFRPNGANETDKLRHGIYYKDLNGDSLDRITQEMLTDLGITLEIERDEEERD